MEITIPIVITLLCTGVLINYTIRLLIGTVTWINQYSCTRSWSDLNGLIWCSVMMVCTGYLSGVIVWLIWSKI